METLRMMALEGLSALLDYLYCTNHERCDQGFEESKARESPLP